MYCTVLLPPGGYPVAINKYININIKNQTASKAAERLWAVVKFGEAQSTHFFVGSNTTTFTRAQRSV
jgi:hypothetical protein